MATSRQFGIMFVIIQAQLTDSDRPKCVDSMFSRSGSIGVGESRNLSLVIVLSNGLWLERLMPQTLV